MIDDIFEDDRNNDNSDLHYVAENGGYLSEQLITYIGNKRKLFNLLRLGIHVIQKKLSKKRLSIFDGFSGSGAVSRLFKPYSNSLYVNDMELYAKIISQCYLSNESEFDMNDICQIVSDLNENKLITNLGTGFIEELYSPKDDNNIQLGERVFYTNNNARIIDNIRRAINSLDPDIRHLFIAPLLSEASIHVNTSGVFKGFYKNSSTHIGQFGGDGENCKDRITGEINLPCPVISKYDSDVYIYQEDTNKLIKTLPELDIVYYDPPYNQHPYGSNYFMLNLICNYKRPVDISDVSGIPTDWNRSEYNTSQSEAFLDNLIMNTKSKYILLSYNDEGIIKYDRIIEILNRYGKCDVVDYNYRAFKAGRNLGDRRSVVTEFLFILEK